MELKDIIFSARNELGLTQLELAKKANVTRFRIETAESKPINLRMYELTQILNALNKSLFLMVDAL